MGMRRTARPITGPITAPAQLIANSTELTPARVQETRTEDDPPHAQGAQAVGLGQAADGDGVGGQVERVHAAGGRDYLDAPGLPEAECVAPGDGSDVPFATFARRLGGRLVLGGAEVGPAAQQVGGHADGDFGRHARQALVLRPGKQAQ